LSFRFVCLLIVVLGAFSASPSFATTIAAAVEEGDLGIANAMGATVMNIGMLTGIQTMFLVLGDGRSPNDFGLVFLFGGVVAAVAEDGTLAVDAGDGWRHQVVGVRDAAGVALAVVE